MRRRPLRAWPGPAMARHDHVAARVERHALGLEQLALEQATRADAALLRHDPLPGHRVDALRRYLAQRVADGARVAAPADDRRDIAVGRDHPRRHLLDRLVDARVERA